MSCSCDWFSSISMVQGEVVVSGSEYMNLTLESGVRFLTLFSTAPSSASPQSPSKRRSLSESSLLISLEFFPECLRPVHIAEAHLMSSSVMPMLWMTQSKHLRKLANTVFFTSADEACTHERTCGTWCAWMPEQYWSCHKPEAEERAEWPSLRNRRCRQVRPHRRRWLREWRLQRNRGRPCWTPISARLESRNPWLGVRERSWFLLEGTDSRRRRHRARPSRSGDYVARQPRRFRCPGRVRRAVRRYKPATYDGKCLKNIVSQKL